MPTADDEAIPARPIESDEGLVDRSPRRLTPLLPEVAWFAALCDDDLEQLGVPAPDLLSS